MTAPSTIAHAAWLSHPATVKLLDTFACPPDRLRFVGGCVRNTLLNEPVSDIDLATTLEPNQVVAQLESAGLRAVPTGIEHGTITAIVDHHPFEITTLRSDVSTDGRRASVAFTTDWREDAMRRDFTMNAIYADHDGTLFDPVGGVSDALARRVIFIGDAHQRLREDYLRILRFFRFGAQYGSGMVDEPGLQACIANADGLHHLSGERVQSEMFKLLAAPSVLPIIKLMADAKVLSKILPSAPSLTTFRSIVAIEQEEGRTPDPLLRLCALLSGEGAMAGILAERLKMSNAAKSRMTAALVRAEEINVYTDENDLKRRFYPMSVEYAADQVLLAWARDQKGDPGAYRRALRIAETWQRPDFPLTGSDILDLGVPSGPQLGDVLSAMQDLWVDHDFALDRGALLSEVRRYLSSKP